MAGLVSLLLFLLIYPGLLMYFINKYTKKSKTKQKLDYKKLFKDIGLILLYSSITIIIMGPLLTAYDNGIPSSTSDLCTNMGGWVYSCTGDNFVGLVTLLPMLIILCIHNYLVVRRIIYIVKQNNQVVNYIYIYIHMICTYAINFSLLLYISGLFISVEFNNTFVELLRLLVVLAPTCLYIPSTLIYCLMQKRKKK